MRVREVDIMFVWETLAEFLSVSDVGLINIHLLADNTYMHERCKAETSL